MIEILGRALISAEAVGPVLLLDEPISFWGGVDVTTGEIVDHHHPQLGCSMKQKVLLMSGVKGSTAGPGALLELLVTGNGPSGIVLLKPDIVGLLAASISYEMTGLKVPVLEINKSISELKNYRKAAIAGDRLVLHH